MFLNQISIHYIIICYSKIPIWKSKPKYNFAFFFLFPSFLTRGPYYHHLWNHYLVKFPGPHVIELQLKNKKSSVEWFCVMDTYRSPVWSYFSGLFLLGLSQKHCLCWKNSGSVAIKRKNLLSDSDCGTPFKITLYILSIL